MYVQFVNKEVAEKAPWKHKDKNWPFMDEKVTVIGAYGNSGCNQMTWWGFGIIC